MKKKNFFFNLSGKTDLFSKFYMILQGELFREKITLARVPPMSNLALKNSKNRSDRDEEARQKYVDTRLLWELVFGFENFNRFEQGLISAQT